jgi:hypothetical protein
VLPPPLSVLAPPISQPTVASNSAVLAPVSTSAIQRFFLSSVFDKLLPVLRPHLKRADLVSLTRVNSDVGSVATVALYREATLRVSSDTKDLRILASGFVDTSRPGISKKEAFTYLGAIHLELPNFEVIQVLSKIGFVKLKELVITSHYLNDIVLQSHAMRAVQDHLYRDYMDPSTQFDFAEAQVISHLVSCASIVDVSVPPATLEYADTERPLGYFKAIVERLGITHAVETLAPGFPNLERISWGETLYSPPFISATRSHFGSDSPETDPWLDEDHDWWIVPDLGTTLSLDDISPINVLKLRIVSASTTFTGLPAKQLVIILDRAAMYKDDGPLLQRFDDLTATTVSTLAVFQSILGNRTVLTSSIIVYLPNPPDWSMRHHIETVYPEMVEDMDDTQMIVDKFLRLASTRKIDIICALTRTSYLESARKVLLDHHAKTEEEKADFGEIEFDFMTRGPWKRSILLPEVDQMDMHSHKRKR